jgi:signal transduction histidine kinase
VEQLPETREASTALALLKTVGEKIVRARDLDSVYETIASLFAGAFPGTSAALFFWQQDTGIWRQAAAFGPPFARDLNEAALAAARDREEMLLLGDEGHSLLEGEQPAFAILPLHAAGPPAAVVLGGTSAQPQLVVEQLPYLELLGLSLAMALHTNSLIEQAWRRTTQMEMIYGVTESARALKPLRATLAAIHTQIERAFDVPLFYIALYDPKRELIDFPYVVDQGQTLELSSISIHDETSLVAWVVRTESDFISDDWSSDPRRPVVGYGGIDTHARSVLCFRLRAGQHIAGVFSVQSSRPNAFDKDAKVLLASIADQVAVIVRNAQLYSTTRELVDTLAREYLTASSLRQNAATIGTSLDRQVILAQLLRSLRETVQFDRAVAGLLDKRQIIVLASEGIPADQPEAELRALLEENELIADVIALREPLFLGDARGAPGWRANGEQLPAWLGVPLLAGDSLVGVMVLQSEKAHSYGEREAWVAMTLASHAALAIQNARLHEAIQRQLTELTTLYEAGAVIAADLDQETVLRTVAGEMVRAVAVESCTILVWNESRQALHMAAHEERQPQDDGPRQRAGLRMVHNLERDPVIRQVFAAQVALALQGETVTSPAEEALLRAAGLSALLLIPMVQRGDTLGLLALGKAEANSSFDQSEVRLAHNLAGQAAVAVEHARLYAQAQHRLQGMSALVEMAQQVTGNLRVEHVMETTVQRLQELLAARASTIALLSEDGSELVVEAAAGIKPQYHHVRIKLGEGVSGRAISEMRTIYVRDSHAESDFLFFDPVLRSLLVVPLVERNKVIGTLTVDSDRPHAFSDSDIQLMTIAAAQVSVAIANARLFEEVEERAAELAEAYEELQESDRLKDELVQNVSHELRTPLTFIRGYVDLLIDGEMGAVNSDQLSALNIVSQKTSEVTRLVEDIMALQRIRADNLLLEEFSMRELLLETLALHQLNVSSRGLELKLEVARGAAMIEGDRGRITQVLNNLIGNAMKFSPDGGTIRLALEEQEDYVQVSVADDGIGVPPDKLNRIFERFYQIDGSARRRFGGAGIGLAIVKRIVEAHQGEIWVESELSRGSRFTFRLPRRAALPSEPSPS